jgi:hypothetical protein
MIALPPLSVLEELTTNRDDNYRDVVANNSHSNDLVSRLFTAARENNHEEIKKLVEQGVNIAAANPQGNRADEVTGNSQQYMRTIISAAQKYYLPGTNHIHDYVKTGLGINLPDDINELIQQFCLEEKTEFDLPNSIPLLIHYAISLNLTDTISALINVIFQNEYYSLVKLTRSTEQLIKQLNNKEQDSYIETFYQWYVKKINEAKDIGTLTNIKERVANCPVINPRREFSTSCGEQIKAFISWLFFTRTDENTPLVQQLNHLINLRMETLKNENHMTENEQAEQQTSLLRTRRSLS